MRVMALKYGADIVYTPELIDVRLGSCERTMNMRLGTVDFIDTKGTLQLRIHPKELGKVIVQIGSGNVAAAVKAAR